MLTRDQIEALSDDPVVLRQQLEEMAGPGAVFKVDSFEGGALPPKAQIRSIRITRDQFAAENHAAGGTSIEIITQPGLGPIRYNAGVRFRDGSMSGRSPFTPTKGPEQQRNFFFGLNGTLIPQKSSFSIFAFGASTYETPNINIVDGTGTRSEPLPLRTPRDNVNVNAQLDYALSLDHTLRFGYNSNLSDAENLGVGDYDEEQRAYSTENRLHNIRAQHFGPLGRRAFTRSRLQVRWSDSESHSAVELPTIRVNDAFTRGGAQVSGGQRSFGFNFGSDLDYVRSIHSLRTGIVVDGGSVRADDTSNYLGTYTFESLDAYLAGRPRSYTRRIGDPRIRYETVQAAVYLQDDIKIRRNFTVSAGGRYEAQTHVRDYGSVMPRVGFTWAPFRSGTTVLRSSWGIFYDWLQGNTYEQTLRVDGFRQRELDIRDPSYPQVPALDEIGLTLPVSRYVLSDGLQLPRTNRLSAGIDQRFPKAMVQLSAVYAYLRGSDQYRGNNLNAPVAGVRPDPTFGNVIEVLSDGRSRQHQLQTALTVSPGALLPLPPSAPRINWKRTTLFVNYTFGINDNDADGPFSIPATGRLAERVGTGGRRRASPVQRLAEQPDRQESAGGAEPQREHRDPLQHPHRPRRERRLRVQRSPGGPRAQHRARRRAVEPQPVHRLRVLVRPEHLEPAARHRRHRRRRRRRAHGADGESAGEPLPAAAVPADAEPHQPRQLHGLQRDDDVAVLPPADQRAGDAEDRHRDAADVLSGAIGVWWRCSKISRRRPPSACGGGVLSAAAWVIRWPVNLTGGQEIRRKFFFKPMSPSPVLLASCRF